MTQFKTFTDAEREGLTLHGLNTTGPSQLSDNFVLGMRYAARAAQAPAVPGWRWVPVEPTLVMLDAGLDFTDTADVYRAMLAAAPAPQAAPQDVLEQAREALISSDNWINMSDGAVAARDKKKVREAIAAIDAAMKEKP